MEFTPERRLPTAADSKSAPLEPFAVEDLFDFSNEDAFDSFNTAGGHSDESSPVLAAVDSCNSSSVSGLPAPDSHPHAPADAGYRTFSGDICVPYDDAAELEWLSNFVEEDSFSSEDLQKLHLISGLSTSTSSGPVKARPDPDTQHPPVSVPAKARSKRSRAAPGSWASSLQLLAHVNQTPTFQKSEPQIMASLTPPVGPGPRLKPGKKKGGGEGGPMAGPNGEGRRCLHCATDKTPQWRTGPMGPKTLCNACGVRYKSGRLVPEYRPAASPTFVLSRHSNSHRKVMELRRQKETTTKHQIQGSHQNTTPPPQFIHGGMVFDMSNTDEYLIHQHAGPDFRQLI